MAPIRRFAHKYVAQFASMTFSSGKFLLLLWLFIRWTSDVVAQTENILFFVIARLLSKVVVWLLIFG